MQEAAELHLAEGRVLEAVDIFLVSTYSYTDASKRAISCILSGLWNIFSLGAALTPIRIAEGKKYLQKASQLDDIAVNGNERAEVRHIVLPNSFHNKVFTNHLFFPLN